MSEGQEAGLNHSSVLPHHEGNGDGVRDCADLAQVLARVQKAPVENLKLLIPNW